MKCVQMELGEPDASGRRRPVPVEGSEYVLDIDQAIMAIGTSPNPLIHRTTEGLETNQKGCIIVKDESGATTREAGYAGGDAVTGPKFAIDAIAAGKEGAVSIHRYVHKGQTLTFGRDRRDYRAFDKSNVAFSVESFDSTPRQKAVSGAAEEAKKTFKDLRGVLTEEQIKKEADRCLGCGAAVVDDYMCIGCGICTTKCKFDAIHLEKVSDYVGGSYFKTLGRIVGNVPAVVSSVVSNKIKYKK